MSPDRTPVLSPRARFARDERGAILVLWALFLAVAFGFLALAFDLGRLATTQTQLQSFADQVALAAAGELDGRNDAITRATAAAAGLIDGQQTFATGSQSLGGAGDYTLTFLTTLPASDLDAATATTTDGTRARYVRVDVNQRTVLTPFAHVNAVLTGKTQLSAGLTAAATAGFTSFACDITPLFFCVPDNSWRADANIGDQIQLRSGGQGAAWGPGNFGFLDPTALPVDSTGPCNGLNGAQLYRCLVGAERGITACIETRAGVDTQPGQRVGLAEAFNTRFDIYQGSMQSRRGDSDYPPAPNTIQGTKPRGGGQCRGNNTDVSAAMPLPRDTCIVSGSCGRFGDGTWNRTAYLNHNHGGSLAGVNTTASTRYEVYKAEIARAAANGTVPLPGFDETGAPQCYNGGPPSAPDRRVVIAAAVDCTSNNIRGSATNIVPLEYVKLFMTEPVQSASSDTDIMVEVIGTAGGAGTGALNGIYQDFVQLYR
jgi:Flp pilus assembly protein TadG